MKNGIDAYVDWVRAEGIPIHEGLLVDMVDLETSDWARYGVKGAVAHLDGRGDFCSMFKIELLPGSMVTVDMAADNPGTWMLHCHSGDHMEAGMMARYEVLPAPAATAATTAR